MKFCVSEIWEKKDDNELPISLHKHQLHWDIGGDHPHGE